MSLNRSTSCSVVEARLIRKPIEDIADILQIIYEELDDLQGMTDTDATREDMATIAREIMRFMETELEVA